MKKSDSNNHNQKKRRGTRPKRTKIPINVSVPVAQAIVDFTFSETAHRLGIYSKDRCVESVMIAFLMQYYDKYQPLIDAYTLDEDKIRTANKDELVARFKRNHQRHQ